jgi:SAM-dependent methyltransferase
VSSADAASPLPFDYDDDPTRWGSRDRDTQRFGDVHAPVAARIEAERLFPVLDVGGGDGELGRFLGASLPVVVDRSVTQLRNAPAPRLRADARELPVRNGSAGAVTMLWMLYHLERPIDAIREARRVLRRNGLFVACTTSRFSDPELIDAYPATTFDAEEAAEIVSDVFPAVEVERWDAPMTFLRDHDSVVRYCRSHLLDSAIAARVDAPLWLTKRGCLVLAYKP